MEPVATEEPEAPAVDEADDEADDDNCEDILTSLAEVPTRDPDEGSGFVMGIYKVGAEVECRTRVCYYFFFFNYGFRQINPTLRSESIFSTSPYLVQFPPNLLLFEQIFLDLLDPSQ